MSLPNIVESMKRAKTMSEEQNPRSELDGIFARFGFSYPRCGISIGKGWVSIFEELLQEIILSGYQVQFQQVKQKFGDLRIYFSSPQHTEVEKLVNAAIEKCSHTCEDCGAEAGHETVGGWIATLCKNCAETRTFEREERISKRSK